MTHQPGVYVPLRALFLVMWLSCPTGGIYINIMISLKVMYLC